MTARGSPAVDAGCGCCQGPAGASMCQLSWAHAGWLDGGLHSRLAWVSQNGPVRQPPPWQQPTPPHALAPWMSPVYQASSSFQYTFTDRPTAAGPLGAIAALGFAAFFLPDLVAGCAAAAAACKCAAGAGTATALSLAAGTPPAAVPGSSFAGEGAAAEGEQPVAPSCAWAGGSRRRQRGFWSASKLPAHSLD